jgi:hypothetical protein
MWCSVLWRRRFRIHRYVAAPKKAQDIIACFDISRGLRYTQGDRSCKFWSKVAMFCLFTADITDHVFVQDVRTMWFFSWSQLATPLFPVTWGILEIVRFGSSWQNPVIFPRNVRYLKTYTLPHVNL